MSQNVSEENKDRENLLYIYHVRRFFLKENRDLVYFRFTFWNCEGNGHAQGIFLIEFDMIDMCIFKRGANTTYYYY